MTQEEKELLVRDLCARLPYGVMCQVDDGEAGLNDGKLAEIDVSNEIELVRFDVSNEIELVRFDADYYWDAYIDDIKPYLFPISSMTEEQRIELYKVLGLGYESHYHLLKEWEDFNDSIDNNDLFLPSSWISDLNKMYNWLDKNHFDYRGLIPMGLAIEAPEGMYN